MGFLKKVSNTLFGSSGPKYSQDKSALTQEYGVQSDLGNLNLIKNADGTYSKNYTSSANDVTRNNLIGQQLGGLTLDNYTPQGSNYTFGSVLSDPTTGYNPTTVSDPTSGYNPSSITDPSSSYETQRITDPTAGYSTSQLYGNINQDTANNAAQSYYDQATRLLNDQFDRQMRSADTNLINRGIQAGTEQYNQVMGDLTDRQNATLNDIANQAVFQGQGLLSTMLGNQAQQTANEGSEMANKNALLQNQNQYLQNQYQQTANEGAEFGNKNALLQNQNQYLQNQALNTANEGLVFDNQGKLISNQAGLLANQGSQLANEGAYYSNLGQILANQGQQVNNEGNVLMNQYRNLSNQGLDLSNAGQYYSNQGQQISNANALAGGRDINTLMGMGGSNDAYDSAYQGRVYNDAMRNERNANMLGTLGSLTGMAKGFSFSDKRLKENLKPVGKLNNGLKVYVGNYKKETGLDTKPQLFLLAQEVKKKKPEAVGKTLGALTVNYKKATE